MHRISSRISTSSNLYKYKLQLSFIRPTTHTFSIVLLEVVQYLLMLRQLIVNDSSVVNIVSHVESNESNHRTQSVSSKKN